MRYGIQVFGPTTDFLRDPDGFLSRLRAAGYRYLEPCVCLEEVPGLSNRIFTPELLEICISAAKKHGFTIESAHIFTQDLARDLPGFTNLAKSCGIRQLVLPCPVFSNDAVFTAMARTVSAAAEQLTPEGIELLLHNDGRSTGHYQHFLDLCNPLVGAQPDVGWLLAGGMDPEAFLWCNQERIRSLHFKDMAPGPQGMREVPLGTGSVDMTGCFQFVRATEIISYADQDTSGDFPGDLARFGELLHNLAQCRNRTESILCVMDTHTGTVTELNRFQEIIEAPNWMHTDPDSLIYNSEGRIFRYRISTKESRILDTGECQNCNNDHVLSPDETQLAVSHSRESWMSQIYILPIEGGEPRLITPNAPSFLHGWSPDGKELAYCAFRDNGKGYAVDIFAISPQGGEEWQLTKDAGFNDGPEYSPDGKHIWFISTRSGLMQCWRMNRDGSNQTQMTFHDRNNWFPHVSPDGQKVVYLSYSSAQGLDPQEHLPNMHVQLRLMNSDGSDDRCILEFFGGQGSINVNSWHPDSRHFAFVRYELSHR